MLNHWVGKFDREDTVQRLKGREAKFAVEICLELNIALGTCFSEERDLLSQWRGYAQGGAGFSISFDRRKLEQVAKEAAGPAKTRLMKIAYGPQDTAEISEIIKSLHKVFGTDANSYSEGANGTGSMSLSFSPEKHGVQRETASSLFTAKNGAFKEEKEWRLFTFDSAENISAMNFREKGGIISPYIKLAIPTDVVTGVTLGPTNATPRAMIEFALRSYGFDCCVSKSGAPYRNR